MPGAEEIERQVRRVIEVSRRAGERGDGPYGGTLVDDAGNILFERGNTEFTTVDPTAHAETNLVRDVIRAGQGERLRDCVLYASTEPCSMCCRVMYQSGVRRVVYANRSQPPPRPAPPGSLPMLELPSIHELMGTGNDHRCVVVHAGEALERLAREVVQQFEDAPGRLVSAGGSSTAARCRGDGGARASARSLL